MPCLDNWGVTKGDAILVQQKEATRAASVCIGPEGDMHNVSTAKCNIRWPGPSIGYILFYFPICTSNT
jgi:hypothetical protein